MDTTPNDKTINLYMWTPRSADLYEREDNDVAIIRFLDPGTYSMDNPVSVECDARYRFLAGLAEDTVRDAGGMQQISQQDVEVMTLYVISRGPIPRGVFPLWGVELMQSGDGTIASTYQSACYNDSFSNGALLALDTFAHVLKRKGQQ